MEGSKVIKNMRNNTSKIFISKWARSMTLKISMKHYGHIDYKWCEQFFDLSKSCIETAYYCFLHIE